eukprot:2943697-Pleurochrysis_carterae.AAC.1
MEETVVMVIREVEMQAIPALLVMLLVCPAMVAVVSATEAGMMVVEMDIEMEHTAMAAARLVATE